MTASMPQAGRPPHVQFETRSVEDRAKTAQAGNPQYRDVDYVVVQQMGSKDTFEREAKEWLESIKHNANIDPTWVHRFHSMYEMFKQGREVMPDGTHVRMWPAATPSEVKTLMAAGMLTVEDLARANDEALRRIGMGGTALKNRARAWLEAAQDTGKTATELHHLRVKTEGQEEQLQQLREQLTLSNKRLEAIIAKQADDLLTEA